MSKLKPKDSSPLKRSTDTNIRFFVLNRKQDASGVSGIGIVAEGVEFTDGTCVLHWKTKYKCTAIYKSILELEYIHGHGGMTEIVWIKK